MKVFDFVIQKKRGEINKKKSRPSKLIDCRQFKVYCNKLVEAVAQERFSLCCWLSFASFTDNLELDLISLSHFIGLWNKSEQIKPWLKDSFCKGEQKKEEKKNTKTKEEHNWIKWNIFWWWASAVNLFICFLCSSLDHESLSIRAEGKRLIRLNKVENPASPVICALEFQFHSNEILFTSPSIHWKLKLLTQLWQFIYKINNFSSTQINKLKEFLFHLRCFCFNCIAQAINRRAIENLGCIVSLMVAASPTLNVTNVYIHCSSSSRKLIHFHCCGFTIFI